MNKSQKMILVRIIISALLSLVFFFLPITGYIRFIAFFLSYLIAGYDVILSAIRNIFSGEIFDEKFLMTIATAGAFAINKYPEAAAIMIFYQIGELFQDLAVEKSKKSISDLMNIRPDYAVVLRNKSEIRVSPEEVKKGEIIIIKPGERVPLDCVIVEGFSTVNNSALTGESLPVDKGVGSILISGSVNLSGVIKAEVESEYGESTVSKILKLVEDASDKKSKSENFITRFSKIYTPCVVVGALLLAIIPPLVFAQPWHMWINRALIFLVVSCPCALVISVPLSFFGGIGGASHKGILIKGSNFIEAISKTDTVVFDKTGTLTKGNFNVNAIHPENISSDSLLDIAAAAESYSSHPVAESIISAHGKHIDKKRISGITEHPGMGIEAVIDGKTFFAGNGRLMDFAGANWHDCHLSGTVIHISEKNNYLGHIVINDEIKSDSVQAITELKALGIKSIVMLTGDSEKTAGTVAKALSIDKYYSELLPEQKVKSVEELIESGRTVAFAGDGINDTPVLARADVGIAMGALGSDAAIEAADIVIMDDKPSKMALMIKISRRTMQIVKQNIIIALSVKLIILALGALGIASMWFAVFGDVGVTIIAVLNAIRAMYIPD